MATYTENQIRELLKGQDTLQHLARSYFWARFDADPDWANGHEPGDDEVDGTNWIARPTIDSITFDKDRVSVECSQRACNRGCCGTDRHTYEFPLSYLWLDQTAILADMAARTKAEKDRKDAEEQETRELREEQQETDERRRLAELKAKYEATP